MKEEGEEGYQDLKQQVSFMLYIVSTLPKRSIFRGGLLKGWGVTIKRRVCWGAIGTIDPTYIETNTPWTGWGEYQLL